MNLILAGKDPARCQGWATRRALYGDSGYKAGFAPSSVVPYRKGKRTSHCKRGHKRRGDVRCPLCVLITKGAYRRRKLLAVVRTKRRAFMIAAHPDRGGSAAKFITARTLYLEVA